MDLQEMRYHWNSKGKTNGFL